MRKLDLKPFSNFFFNIQHWQVIFFIFFACLYRFSHINRKNFSVNVCSVLLSEVNSLARATYRFISTLIVKYSNRLSLIICFITMTHRNYTWLGCWSTQYKSQHVVYNFLLDPFQPEALQAHHHFFYEL